MRCLSAACCARASGLRTTAASGAAGVSDASSILSSMCITTSSPEAPVQRQHAQSGAAAATRCMPDGAHCPHGAPSGALSPMLRFFYDGAAPTGEELTGMYVTPKAQNKRARALYITHCAGWLHFWCSGERWRWRRRRPPTAARARASATGRAAHSSSHLLAPDPLQ